MRHSVRHLRVLLSFALMTAALVVLPAGVSAATVPCTGMTTGVYEVINPQTGAALYTRSKGEADAAAKHGFTELGGTPFAVGDAVPNAVAVHRLHHPGSWDFVWIQAGSEPSAAVQKYGYVDQGPNFFASSGPATGCVPVHRFVRGAYHRLAVTDKDQQALLDAGWRYEKIAFYAAPGESTSSGSIDKPAPPPTEQEPVAVQPESAPATDDPNFTFAVLPDTQKETLSSDGRFAQRTKWLADNKSSLDLRWALHSGDVVNWGWLVPSEYSVATSAMANLEAAKIPYSLAVGNHDTRAVGWNGIPGSTGYGGAAYMNNPECPVRLGASLCDSTKLVRHTQEFNAAFNINRYGTPTTAFEPGKVDNVYQTYTAGGVKWLVLTLELWPRTSVVGWAKNVVQSHPDHNVIVVTHAYLNGDGSISGSNGGYGATSPQYLYDNLIKVYPNIRMVFSGHVGVAATRTDVGVNGNTVYSFLQTFHSDTNPVRLITVDTQAATISTKVVVPKTGETYSSHSKTYTGVSFVR